MSENAGYTPPPVPQSGDPTQASTVRRHHTIASSSGRMGPRIAERRDSEEAAAEEDENDDQWTGGAAMSSEKQASLQRNLSLPSKYHRREFKCHFSIEQSAFSCSGDRRRSRC
jgi:hypothetical protein